MTTSVQVQYRRGTQAQMAAFTGAPGEMNVDTSNNRVVVQDGTTAGGWPAAKLCEIGGGHLSKFRNGTMDVWQRGTSSLTATTAGAYTADGWIVLPAGASVTAAQAGGRLLTKASLQVTGASSVTDVLIKQRIESLIAAALCSQTVTVQAQVFNNTGASITPALTVNRPNAQDNYASVTADVNAAPLQACANGAWTRIAYTFQANAASYNGIEILFDFGNNLGSNAKSVQITECDIRVTNGVPTGINANPPPPELRLIGPELMLCQRYYWRNATGLLFGSYAFGASSSSTSASFFISYPTTMRAAPTLTQSNTAVTVNFGAANATTGLGSVQAGPMSAFVPVSVASGLTANELANWINNNNSAGYIDASAEL
jgi:major tropism determinant Mtd-like protein